MIRVEPQTEPVDFNDKVRTPGLRAIAEMVGERSDRTVGRTYKKICDRREDIPCKKFRDYWKHAIPDLLVAYGQICAYTCLKINAVTGSATVDHYLAKSKHWDKVYEWNNYRLACGRINARKGTHDDILDPFEVEDDWFELELVGFQVIPAEYLQPDIDARVQKTIDRLGLNDFRKERAEKAEEYFSGNVSLKYLVKESPFVARELIRQGRLRPEDQTPENLAIKQRYDLIVAVRKSHV